MCHGLIQKITLAQFFLRHGVMRLLTRYSTVTKTRIQQIAGHIWDNLPIESHV